MIGWNRIVSPPPRRLGLLACLLACAFPLLAAASVSPARAAGIGFPTGPSGWDGSITNADGSPDVQAGSHPYEVTTSFNLNTVADSNGKLHDEGGDLKDVQVNLPPGLFGDVNAVPVCSETEFFTILLEPLGAACKDDTVVGILHVKTGSFGGGNIYTPVYNLQPPAGAAAAFGAQVGGGVLLFASVRSGSDYGVSISVTNIPQLVPITGNTITFWGVPADPRHDPLRSTSCLNGDTGASEGSCPSGAPLTPLLTLPTSCTGPLAFSIAVDSWASPGLFATDSFLTHDGSGNPIGLEGCNRLSLVPGLEVKPTVDQASTPSGLDFKIDIADEGLTSPEGLAQPQIKKTVVTLPEGVTVNPSAGEGLGACTPSDYHRETAESAPGAGCPNSSKIGEVTIESPLLQQPVKGSLFIAQPDDPATTTPGAENPFDSLLAIYIVAKLPERGIIIKAAGKIEPNPETGQLTTTFDNLPQLPFAHFRLHFREGQSAPLVSPPACGTYTAQASFVPWSAADLNNPAPAEVVHENSSFTITKGVHEGPCPSGGVPPFKPQVTSGTQNNAAASYSPFYLRIAREDGEQELTRFSTTLPPGLTGNLTGIPFCPDAQVEAARGHTGGQEEGEPSCPASSQVGHTLVGAGVGSVLAHTPGRLYLAGPYHGAPLSLVSITSAKVGPFDLGTVVIRFALRINPITAQVEVDATGSDPIPHIIQGIVVHVRDIRAYIDRPGFIKNPTSCERLQIANTITGAGQDPSNPAGQQAVNVTSAFQAADCQSLAFKPTFKASVTGKNSKAGGAALKVNIVYPNAPQGSEANIHTVKVELPRQLPSRLTTLQRACLAKVFEENPASCPKESVVGQARAVTPILPVPLVGPAYFVSHGGEAFPSLIMVLQGYGVTIDLVGSTFISKSGITSSTFKAVPDQPVTSFELTLPQGKFSALAANGNLCSLTRTVLVKKRVTVKVRGHRRTVTRKVRKTIPASLQMPTEFVAQNGATIHQTTPVTVTGCPKAVHAKHHKTKGKGKRKK
jgi:hypothetical protein